MVLVVIEGKETKLSDRHTTTISTGPVLVLITVMIFRLAWRGEPKEDDGDGGGNDDDEDDDDVCFWSNPNTRTFQPNQHYHHHHHHQQQQHTPAIPSSRLIDWQIIDSMGGGRWAIF